MEEAEGEPDRPTAACGQRTFLTAKWLITRETNPPRTEAQHAGRGHAYFETPPWSLCSFQTKGLGLEQNILLSNLIVSKYGVTVTQSSQVKGH